MILSDTSILYMSEVNKMIEPFCVRNLQPGSYDLTLGDTFLLDGGSGVFDLKEDRPKYEKVCAEEIEIKPGTFLLGTTQERVKIPHDITGFISGRSSVGRSGLFIENAGLIDAGFEGQITLELYNASAKTIRIHKGQRIGQITFHAMDMNAKIPYNGKYQGQSGATGTRMYEDS